MQLDIDHLWLSSKAEVMMILRTASGQSIMPKGWTRNREWTKYNHAKGSIHNRSLFKVYLQWFNLCVCQAESPGGHWLQCMCG